MCRRATRDMTYIGPERDNSTEAISFARTLCRHVEARYAPLFRRSPGPAPAALPPLPPESDPLWKVVKALSLRTWVRVPSMVSPMSPAVLLSRLHITVALFFPNLVRTPIACGSAQCSCSVLGLAEDREVLGIAIDYTSTVEQLYIDTAIKILEAKPVVRFLFK
ncbi:hypothetical protein VUR80DRAFT_3236 [Thermomyces stellatus]